MDFNLNLHKTIESLLKIKLPQLTIFLAFISSFNLWFLSIYFFKHDLISHHGYIITLLVTLALTTSWCLIIGIAVPKFMIWLIIISCPDELEEEETQSSKLMMNLFVFFEIILVHGFFIWIQYLVQWKFFLFLSVVFVFAMVQFLIIDSLVKSAFLKHQKSKNTSKL